MMDKEFDLKGKEDEEIITERLHTNLLISSMRKPKRILLNFFLKKW